jgi:hypothetical protein
MCYDKNDEKMSTMLKVIAGGSSSSKMNPKPKTPTRSRDLQETTNSNTLKVHTGINTPKAWGCAKSDPPHRQDRLIVAKIAHRRLMGQIMTPFLVQNGSNWAVNGGYINIVSESGNKTINSITNEAKHNQLTIVIVIVML